MRCNQVVVNLYDGFYVFELSAINACISWSVICSAMIKPLVNLCGEKRFTVLLLLLNDLVSSKSSTHF